MTTINPSKHTSSKSSKKRSAHKVHTLPLATMAALLTAATCLGSQPAMAVPTNTITTPTYTATAKKLTKATGVVYQDREYIPLGDKKSWLQYPNILEFRRLRGRNSDATEIKSDEEGSDSNWRTVNDKTAMYAHVETRDNSDYLVFDVFFNNNATSMISKSSKQWYLWQVPYAIADLDSNGLYKSDTVTNLRYDAYRPKTKGHILSQDPEAFEKDNSLSFSVPNMKETDKHFGKDSYALYQVGIGLNPGDKLYDDLDQIFHKNQNEPLISRMAADQAMYAYTNGKQYNKNYGLGITVAKPYDDVAYHMHAELKLRPGAINKDADNYNEKYANIQNAWTWANSGSWGATTSSAYTVISGRDPSNDEDKDGKLKRNKTDSKAPKIYYNGKEITDSTKPIKLKEGDKLSFTTTDDKGYIEKFSISGLTDTPITKQGVVSEDKPLPSGNITVTNDMNNKTVTITSEDGSGNVTTRKVKVKVTKKPKLSKEHPLTGKTITTTVGEQLPPLAEIDNFVTVKDGNKLDKQPTLSWKGTAPNTDTVGVFTHSIEGTYSDKSTNTATVTINVKPKKPVIETNLTNLAGKKGQKVTVSVGSGIPEGTTTTVKLFDKNGKEIGSTTTINNGKAEITVNDGIPEGAVYATTTVKKPDKKDGPKKTIPGFELISENSDKKQATAPKDNEKPTITATADSLSVAVGQDLKIHIVAKDDVKVEEVPNAQALMQGLGLELNELSSRIKSSQTTNTDKEKDFDLTVKNMQPKEVGTHTITFTVKDSAGNTGTTTLTITVKPTVSNPKAENKTGNNKTTVSGNATPGATVTISKNGQKVGETTAKDDGTFTVDIDKQDPNTTLTLTPSKGDVTGTPVTATVTGNETPAAKPTVSNPKAENKTGNNKTTVSGNATPGATVTISKNGQKVGETTAKDDGTFTVDIDKQDPNTTLTLTPSKGDVTGTPVTATVTGNETPNDGNSGSGDSGSGSEAGNSNSSESDSGNDSKSNNAGNASTGASGSNASTKSDNRVPAKHSSQLVKTGAEVERVGLISAMIGVLGAAAAFFSRKKNRE